MRKLLGVTIALMSAAPASAEVVSAGTNGFEVRHGVSLVIPREQAYAAFGQVQNWWDKGHTYSGNASRLSMVLRAGGCFCERLDGGGGIEHLRVTYVQPGERVVLTGSLGPLLFEATAGVMDVKFEKIAGGTRIVASYRAAGFARGSAGEMAPLVDTVLGEQMKRLRIYAAGGAPKP